MKKTFITPVIAMAELTSGEDVMFLSLDLAGHNEKVQYGNEIFADNAKNDKFDYWAGKKDSWM